MTSSQPVSSGSEIDAKYASIDEKKRKRMLSNRESAKRSRIKKQKMIEDLANEQGRLLREVENNKRLCLESEKAWYAKESENNVLRAEKTSLAHQLTCLQSLIKKLDLSVNASKTPAPLVDPRNVLSVRQLVMASAGMLRR